VPQRTITMWNLAATLECSVGSPVPFAGYTLVDVLAAVVLTAILSAVAVPQLCAVRAQFDLQSSARAIVVDLQRARMKAVGENGFCRVVFDASGSYVRQCSADGVVFVDDGPVTYLPMGTAFVNAPDALPQPTFNRLGTAAGDASITVSNRLRQRKEVRVNALGRITIS
jgi:Tfp pilus assembly protein FimT